MNDIRETPEIYDPEHSTAGKIVQLVKEMNVLGSQEDLELILAIVARLYRQVAGKAWGVD
jgi:hypothetical protein